MKKGFLVLCCLVSVCSYADFVNLNLRNQNISVAEASSHFSEWFGVPNDSFVLFDTTKDGSMEHYAYQQYFNDIVVENCVVFVHAKNGKVTYISGDIYKEPIEVKSKISKRAARKVAEIDDTTKVEETIIHKGNIFYNVYKIYKPTEVVYIDVETGEIVQRYPLVINSSVTCNISTKYQAQSNQTIKCEYEDNKYYLSNLSKGIVTCYADMTNLFNNTGSFINPQPFSSSSSNWDSSYLTSVTITGCYNSWWDNILGTDGYPELYIRVEDGSGNLLFISDYKEVKSLPVTYRIADMIRIPAGGGSYKVKIYDRDEGTLDSDDLGLTVTITKNTLGTLSFGTAGSSNVTGTIELSKWHPALDVEWGLEKIYDFYLNKFGLSSFDGANAPIKATLHSVYTTKNVSAETTWYNNAYATSDGTNSSSAYIFLGMGNEKGNSQVGFNTICHEYTHLVTTFRPKKGLVYQGESGSINEGYSDAMAISAEYYTLGSTDWKYDKNSVIDATHDCCRNLKHPEYGEPTADGGWITKPSAYGDANWIDPTGTTDNGGVHLNNSIFTYWYYLLCEGGSGTNTLGNYYKVDGIGMEKALNIIWALHRDYILPQSTFAQLREDALNLAIDSFGIASQEYKSIVDAWYAVGVGNKYLEPLKPGKYVVLASTDTCSWFMSSTLTSSSTKRLIADTINAYKDYFYVNPDPDYLWEITQNPNGTYYFKGNGNYLSWNSGNSAAMSATPKELTVSQADDYDYMVSFPSSATETRYLSLNNNNPYFAFYSNQGQNYKLNFLEAVIADTLTIRAKMPSNWGSTIRAWVWYDGETGYWETPTKEGDWYVFKGMIYDEYTKFNIIFVNGTNWSTDNNQTVDISVSQDMCIQIGNNSGKRTYTSIDCEDEGNENVYILAKRKTGDYYYLTQTSVSDKERLVAVDAGDSVLSRINTSSVPSSYIWTIVKGTSGVTLKSNSNQYLYASAAKTAKLNATGLVLTQRSNIDGTTSFVYANTATENWYLSLANKGSDYFVFYANENQVTHFVLINAGTDTPTSIVLPPTTSERRKVFINGQVYILEDGKRYDLLGRQVL